MSDRTASISVDDAKNIHMLRAELARAIDVACTASCTCLTKTPEPQYHAETCRYRCLRRVSDGLRAPEADLPALICLEDSGPRPGLYLRLDLAFGHAEAGLAEILSEVTGHMRAMLPRVRFQEADPRPLMSALAKAEAVLASKPSFVPLENHDDG